MSPRDWCIGRTASSDPRPRRRRARAAGAARPRRRARRRPRPVAHLDRRSLPVHPARHLGLDELEPEGDHLPDRRLLRAPPGRRRGLQVLPGQAGALRGADRSGLPKVELGFATYNQDQLAVAQKHWLYQAAGNGVLLTGGTYFPAAGAQEVFGNALGLRHRQQRQ